MNVPQLHHFGEDIRRLRKVLRLSQEAFSERAGIDSRHFQDIEGGKVDVGYRCLRKIHLAKAVAQIHGNHEWNLRAPGDVKSRCVGPIRSHSCPFVSIRGSN
jgi:predicted transcriptional regulator